VFAVTFSNTVKLYESGLGDSFTSVTEINAYTVVDRVPDTLMASTKLVWPDSKFRPFCSMGAQGK
jgi:hypothetical protein